MIGDEQFAAIARLNAKGHRLEKYFVDPRKWFSEEVQRVIAMGLVGKPKRWILEVGCRVPYLAAAASLFGHDVLSVGPPDPLISRVAGILGYDYVGHEPTHENPLPTLPHRFDLIAAFHGLQVDGHECDMKEAGHVVDEMIRRLNPGGIVILLFPPQWMRGRWQLASRWRRVLKSRCRITKPAEWILIETK